MSDWRCRWCSLTLLRRNGCWLPYRTENGRVVVMSFSCTHGRAHHPDLDVPSRYALGSQNLLERWLAAT